MTPRLSEISKELADRLLNEVDFDNCLTGWCMRQMSGNAPTLLYSLTEVADFIKIPELDNTFSPGSGGSIGFVDIAELATWIHKVLGDKELAEAMDQAHTKAGSYAEAAAEARDLIHNRIMQCHRS